MFKSALKHAVGALLLSSAVSFAWADDAAPVYDADNFPPQFDGQADSGPSSQQADFSSPAASAPAPSLSLDQRLSRAEHQISNIQSKDLSNRVETLQADIRSLRGEVDQLTRQLQQLQTQQRAMFSDIDKRINNSNAASKNQPIVASDTTSPKQPPAVVKTKTPAVPAETDVTEKTPAPAAAAKQDTAAAASEQPNVAEEQQIYQTAYDLIKVKKYNEAIGALQKMLQKYPTGQFAANAHYWLGELYGLLGKNDQSSAEFGAIVKNYPDSPKVADAQLKLGLIYAAQFKWSDAKAAFKKVINHYPGTATARLAAEQLKQIKEAGH